MLAFPCSEVRYTFDRDDPIDRATYWVRTTGTVRERVCGTYATDSSGQRYCARWRTEVVERELTRTGPLRLRPRG